MASSRIGVFGLSFLVFALAGAATDPAVPDEEDEEEEARPSAPVVPVEEFLRSTGHPVLVAISADYIVYASDRKLLYARGNVRYSGRGFAIAAETLRLDIDPQRAVLNGVRGVLRRGQQEQAFQGDVLRLDLQRRRGVLTTYGDRIVVERVWLPEKGEIPTSTTELEFQQLENLPVDADLGRIIDGRLYLELERLKIDPESRIRAWGVVPYIEGQPGPRLPYFSFRTGEAQPREGLTIRSLGASNVSGIRGEATYSLSPAERLLTTFELRYEELSLLKDPFRPKRRARFGLNQRLLLSEALDAQLGGFYQTDSQWEGRLGLLVERGAHSASLEALVQNDPVTGRHDRLRARYTLDREQLHSELEANLDRATQLDLRWNFNSRLWKDRLSLQANTSYLRRFERGIYQEAQNFTESVVASLTVSNFVTTLSYFGLQDLERGEASHNPSLAFETLPRNIGAGFLVAAGNQVQLSSIVSSQPGLSSFRVNNELWTSLQHTPIYFTEKLSYDARLRVSQKFLEGIDDETSFEGFNTLTRRIGQASFAALSYRYLTIRQSRSEWLTAGSVLQELQASGQIRLDRAKQLYGQGRYSISEGQPLDVFLQFTGDFGLFWKTTLRSGYDFRRDRFNVLDVSVSRDVFFGWMRITYRQVQNELSVDYSAKVF